MTMKKMILIIILAAVAIFLAIYIPSRSTPQSPTPVPTPSPTPLPPQEGLPASVEATRQAIYQAALSRDYDKLAALATYPNFSYSFGGPYPGGFKEYLKLAETTERESAFDVIPTLLRLPYGYSNGIYTWPWVHFKQPKDWTEEDVALLRTFVSDERIEHFREYGGYIYYRLGINEGGTWIYYIAGD